ncbi:MAG: hypothetical protein ABFS86_12650 [Planctomycetota bacterium]
MKILSVLLTLTVAMAAMIACSMTAPEAAPDEDKAAPEKAVPEEKPAAPEEAAPEKPAPGEVAAAHPEIEEEMKLTPCAQCHKIATPKVWKEWHESTHGIGNVKCYQCHGTYENFAKVPEMNRCATCHAGHVTSRMKKVACTDCHVSHRFRGHARKEVKK